MALGGVPLGSHDIYIYINDCCAIYSLKLVVMIESMIAII